MAAKRKVKTEEVVLAEGVRLSRGFFEKEENRTFTLLLKGFIVYLYTMGGIGFYLSAFSIAYNKPVVHAVIFVMAILCALLYYRLLTENLGYLVLLLAFLGLVYLFKDYINSGFYALVNISVEEAARYFDVSMKRLYNERIGDRYVTVTMAALFIGIVLDILLNVYISRRMQYINALITVIPVNLIPLYMIKEPDAVYAFMIVAATAMSIIYKHSKHYNLLLQVKRTDTLFAKKEKRKKTEFSYVYDIKALLQAGGIAFAFAAVVVLAVTVFRPVERFNVGYKPNKYKEVTMAAVGTVLVDGIEGLLPHREMNGGINSGELGAVGSIKLDHKTDLMLEFTPCSTQMIYLKGFTADTYMPYENYWTSSHNLDDETYHPEADVLQSAYEDGYDYASRGVFRVNNVGGERWRLYRPYYYSKKSSTSRYEDMEFYPRLDKNETQITAQDYPNGQPYTKQDLAVPKENLVAVDELCRKLNLSGLSVEETVEAVRVYFQDEVPYTVKPGKTPKGEDFVNYFLEENPKGYCVHFASTAVLMFRNMGIPARYVEGYAISIDQVYDGEIVEDRLYKDYFDGYNTLGETALVQVNATDADAHAWVEIYEEGKGWYPVDITPAAESEEDTSDFWEQFDEIMGDGDEDNTQDGTGIALALPRDVIRRIFIIILELIGAAILVLLLIRLAFYIRYLVIFAHATTNDKLIMRYTKLRKKRARRDKDFRELLNYRTQLVYLAGLRGDREQTVESLVGVLEKAGFSNKPIDEPVYKSALEQVEELFAVKKKKA